MGGILAVAGLAVYFAAPLWDHSRRRDIEQEQTTTPWKSLHKVAQAVNRFHKRHGRFPERYEQIAKGVPYDVSKLALSGHAYTWRISKPAPGTTLHPENHIWVTVRKPDGSKTTESFPLSMLD